MKRILDTQKLNIIGPRMKEARTNAGLSQKQLSEKLELLAVYTCRGSISRIENGSHYRYRNRCYIKSFECVT